MIKPFVYLRLCALFSCSLLLDAYGNVEAAEPVPANPLKAAYLIHLSEFTTWPDAKMQLPFFSICLASESELRESLEQIRGQKVKDKPLDILYDVPASKLNICHVFYVENALNKKIFLQSMQKSDPILTVSSDDDFVKEGGVIEYYRDDEKLRMKINLKILAQLKLIISSKLLRLMQAF